MAALKLSLGRDIEDIKEALNLLILLCRENEGFKQYEGTLLEMECAVCSYKAKGSHVKEVKDGDL